MTGTKFKSEKFLQTAEIILNGKIESVFPLFGAFEERKWAEGWNPVLVSPSEEIIAEGTTFKTKGYDHDEAEFIWRVTRYKPDKFIIQYLVNTENRYWTITIKCSPEKEDKTSAVITYSYIGLNELGNKLNEHAIKRMFRANLKDWEEEINSYLKNN